MEKYRLKQWYPNLHLAWSTTDNYEYDREGNRMYNRTRWGTISITAPYLHPDFWELIEEKKPLFVTEDGVEITDGMQSVIAIDSDFNVDYTRYKWANKTHLIFGSKEGADRYIWQNRRLFSYKDIEKFQSGGEGVFYDVEAIAKERSKE